MCVCVCVLGGGGDNLSKNVQVLSFSREKVILCLNRWSYWLEVSFARWRVY